jgi:hypothetical protein
VPGLKYCDRAPGVSLGKLSSVDVFAFEMRGLNVVSSRTPWCKNRSLSSANANRPPVNRIRSIVRNSRCRLDEAQSPNSRRGFVALDV